MKLWEELFACTPLQCLCFLKDSCPVHFEGLQCKPSFSCTQLPQIKLSCTFFDTQVSLGSSKNGISLPNLLATTGLPPDRTISYQLPSSSSVLMTPSTTHHLKHCLNRIIRNTIPSYQSSESVDSCTVHQKARDNDKKRKEKMKHYADKSELKLGDTVLVKQPKRNKFTTTFDPNPLTVVAVKGSMISAQGARTWITRNISHFKKFEGETTYTESVRDRNSDSEPDDYDVPGQLVPADTPAPAPRRYPVRQRDRPRYLVEEA